MTAVQLQLSSRVNGVHPKDTASHEPTNASSSALRSETSSTASIIKERGSQAVRVPPPAPSPPPLKSRRLPPTSSQTPFNNPQPSTMTTTGMGPSSQWLFTDEEIHDSPSIRDGLPISEEVARRAKGVNFLMQAGILLKIPQLTLATAAVFFHRFYMRYSMVTENGKGGIHHYNIAATALFLATKAEENCRKTKEIVIAVVKIAQKNASLIIDEQSKEFWRWKDSILLYEETMLELLTFDVVLESPYNCLFDFLKRLQLETNKGMRNVSWAFLNDSCLTTLCLLMPPRDIAVAALYFAAKYNNERLPDNPDGTPWWTRLSGVPDKIVKAIDVMADFWTDNPLKKGDNVYEKSPGSSEDLDRTRLRLDSRSPSMRSEKMEVDEDNDQAKVMNGKMDEAPTRNENLEEIPVKMETGGDTADTAAGDDDSKLKAAANDPATHERLENGTANGFQHDGSNRRETERAVDEPQAKRQKTESPHEESEEGEVEE